MRVLVLGGTGFIGRFVVERLHGQGHALAVLHRGLSPATLPPGTVQLRGDRRDLPAVAYDLRAFAPEVVVDMIPSSGAQGEALMSIFRGVAGRLVVVSSMDVYRTLPEGLRRTVEWERAHPPPEWDTGQFDYAAEDAALRE